MGLYMSYWKPEWVYVGLIEDSNRFIYDLLKNQMGIYDLLKSKMGLYMTYRRPQWVSIWLAEDPWQNNV